MIKTVRDYADEIARRPSLLGELLEPSLMPREVHPRKMGCWSGVKGLAAGKRQAPAEHATQSGMSTAVLGV